MYKCLNCGNTEKFIGFAQEKGKAYIYQHNCQCHPRKHHKENYSWNYVISDRNWEGSINIQRCFYCNSKKIVEIK